MKAKEYARVLEHLVQGAESEKNLNEKVEEFLFYVKEKNRVPLLSKIARELERKWQNDIQNIHIERGIKGEKSERTENTRELFGKKGIATRVTERVNPRLISGVKITIDDNYLIEASLEGAINQMFNTNG